MAIAFVAKSETALDFGTTFPATVPVGVANDDVLIWFMHSNSSFRTWSNPAGWTRLVTADSPGYMAVWYRVASSEPASYNAVLSGTSNAGGFMLCYRGDHPTPPIDVSAYVHTAGQSASHSGPSVTATGPGMLVVLVATTFSTNQTYTSATGGMTLRVTGPQMSAGAADLVLTSGGATGVHSLGANLLSDTEGFDGASLVIRQPAAGTHQMVV